MVISSQAPQHDPALVAEVTSQTTDVKSIDGRTARALRTRQAIVDATLALVEEGDIRPTAPRIAERAGVSVRSIFQHFDDLESLFYDLAERTMERVSALRAHIDPTAPLPDRLREYLDQRCAINEAITPINRAAVVYASTSPTIRDRFEDGHELVSVRLAEVFARELEAVGDRSADLRDALLIAGSWATWNLLRSLEQRSIAEAASTVEAQFHLALRGVGIDHGSP